MFTSVVCNTLVLGSSRSCSGLFVDLRDHYCQDTAAEISVRSVGFRGDGSQVPNLSVLVKPWRFDYLSAPEPGLRVSYEN